MIRGVRLRFAALWILIFALICNTGFCFSEAEDYVWDCPECGRQGNTGNFCGSCAHPAPWKETEATDQDRYAVGNYVMFGTYPQTAVGTDKTPIEWLILARDGQKALLLSRYGLDARCYDVKYTCTWETCSLRRWLNTIFINKAFTTAEQARIAESEVDNSQGQGYSKWSTESGNNTMDRIFLLSYAEANKYLNVTFANSSNNSESKVFPTEYAVQRGAVKIKLNKKTENVEYSGWWWLRSPGSIQSQTALVYTAGNLADFPASNTSGCIRPALWINIESGFFSEDDYFVWNCMDCGRKGNAENYCASCGHPAPWKEKETTDQDKYAIGNYVTFGTYPQTAGGNDKTPIEWFVLERDGKKALLLSRYGLDAKPYNDEWKSITWETCTLRKWLNEDFVKKAFTADEQTGIIETEVDNSKSQGGGWDTQSENNTLDRIFMLSYAEVQEYLFSNFTENTETRVSPTAYAMAQGASVSGEYKTETGEDAGLWWLRSPGNGQDSALGVYFSGLLLISPVVEGNVCVRPALWINLESGIF